MHTSMEEMLLVLPSFIFFAVFSVFGPFILHASYRKCSWSEQISRWLKFQVLCERELTSGKKFTAHIYLLWHCACECECVCCETNKKPTITQEKHFQPLCVCAWCSRVDWSERQFALCSIPNLNTGKCMRQSKTKYAIRREWNWLPHFFPPSSA